MKHTTQRNLIASLVSPRVDCVNGQLFGEYAGIDTNDNLNLKVPPM
jgi:hypothetical protein